MKRALFLMLAMAVAAPVRGQTATRIGIELDNDFFVSFDPARATDHDYTHGTMLWLQSSRIDPLKHVFGGRLACQDAHPCHYRFSLSQRIFTPRFEASDPVEGERPHAGWLNASMEAVRGSSSATTSVVLQLGVVGPPALAEEVQSAFHRMFDFRPPVGWEHQLPFEPTVQVGVRRHVDLFSAGSRATRIAAGYTTGADLGNALTRVTGNLGMAACLGSVTCSHWRGGRGGSGITLRGSVGSRLVLRDVFLDGTIRESHSVRKEPWVPHATAAVAVHVGRFGAEYSRAWRRREYRTEPSGFSFGSVRLHYGW